MLTNNTCSNSCQTVHLFSDITQKERKFIDHYFYRYCCYRFYTRPPRRRQLQNILSVLRPTSRSKDNDAYRKIFPFLLFFRLLLTRRLRTGCSRMLIYFSNIFVRKKNKNQREKHRRKKTRENAENIN
jgi:hypothetical protein